ncbi:MAG: ABC transporter permease [Clostridiales bacterium]|nr:ABC transporter permease [Clostridiales bacterium]
MSTVSVKEPLMHIVKRDDNSLWRNVYIRVIAVVCSLIVCAFIIFGLTGMNPLAVYGGIWNGAVGTTRRMWVTFRDAAILLCVGLAITPAFKMRFWNIGAEGQVLVGALATAGMMITFPQLPPALLYTVSLLAGVMAGMIWGAIPAIFKANWNTNETLFTLMLNYIAMQLVTFCIIFWENPKGSNSVGLINKGTKEGWLPSILDNGYILPIIIVLVIAALMFIYMRYSKQGYEISVVGESENTAHYAGINVKRVIIRTMMISGGIAGLAGFLLVSGVGHTISTSVANNRGFTAIIVAWLGKLNPFFMLIVAFLLVFMEKGSSQIATQFGLNENASEIMTGIILFFVLGCEFFINYRIEFRGKRHEEVKA